MEITVSIQGDTALMEIEGVVSTDNAYILQEKLDEVKDSGVKKLDLDFSQCRIISSTGIGKLMLFYKDFHPHGGSMEVIKCSPHVYELFNTIKLNMIMNISL